MKEEKESATAVESQNQILCNTWKVTGFTFYQHA